MTEQRHRETVYSLYNAWRYARARWDAALYAPDRDDEDLPREIGAPLEDPDGEAFERFMLQPARSAADLSRKLKVFSDEDGHELTNAAAYLAVLAQDARRVALAQPIEQVVHG